MKGSSFWTLTDECFICDKWRYTVVLWNKNLEQRFSIVPQKNEFLEKIISHVQQENLRYQEIRETAE